MAVAAGVVLDAEGAEAPSGDARWLRRWRRTGSWRSWLRAAGRTRGCGSAGAAAARDAERDAELERLRADLAVLQRMLFGRSSEKSRPEPPAGGGDDAGGGGGRDRDRRAAAGTKRGPGARAGRRDYSHLPRLRCSGISRAAGTAARSAGSRSRCWGITVRGAAGLAGDRAAGRRTAAAGTGGPAGAGCPATVMAPGPPKAIGKGLFTNGFIAMLLTERFAAGRSMNSLVTGPGPAGRGDLARHAGGHVRAGRGAARPAGGRDHGAVAGLLAPARRRDDVAGLRPRRRGRPGEVVAVGVHRPGHRLLRDGPDPVRGGPGPPCRASTRRPGSSPAGEDGGPRRLVISSDFYKVYESAGKKADGLVNLYCWAHVRRHFVRAGDANPVQLKYWTDAWLDRIRDLYAAHDELMAAWQDAAAPAPQEKQAAAARLEKAYAAWDDAITVIDEARKKQMQAPGLQEPAKKALATLDREWDGLTAHRDYPMVGAGQ